MPESDEQRPSGPPDYKVYKARKGLLSRFRKPDLPSLRDRSKKPPRLPDGKADSGRSRVNGKRILKWVGIAALGWIALSFLAFAVSAQIQAFKLSGEAKSALHGNPFLLVNPQTILVIGTDARDPTPPSPATRRPRSASTSRRTATPRTAPARSASSAPTP